MATVNGTSANDTLAGTASDDTIIGEAGNDVIMAGDGNDVIDGSSTTLSPTALFLDWTALGADGTSLTGGFTQNTGGINVTVGLTNDGAGTSAEVSTDPTYTAAGDPFDATSGLALVANGGADAWTTDISFASAPGSGLASGVQNVSFRIQDVDQSGWQDLITINATDANGNPVTVTLTPSGDDTVSGNTIVAGGSSTGATDPLGSVLVTIEGPVTDIEIIYENGGTSGQLLYITDVHFEGLPDDDDTIDGEGGDDTIFGGIGEDVIDGGAGTDTIEGGAGADDLFGGTDSDSIAGDGGSDTLYGGTGSDQLYGGADADTLFGGAGFDTLVGGAGSDTLFGGNGNDQFFAAGGDSVVGGEGGTDTADTLIVDDVDRVEFDPSDSEAGTVFFNDGTTLDFIEIENLTVNGGPTGTVEGTGGDDLIDASYVDAQLEQVDANDGTLGTTGDLDVIEAGLGNDTVYAGQSDDLVVGGADTLPLVTQSLNWGDQGTSTDVSAGFAQDTGTANITVSVTDDGGLTNATTSTVGQYVAAGEPMDAGSALSIGGDGGPDVATIGFASDVPLENVQFRINDVDSGGWQDILTVNAFDADGNPVAVTLTAAGDDTVTGQTVTGGGVNDQAGIANGSVLVEIAGPVASFEIIYENGSTGGQVVYVTDVYFDAPAKDDDILHGDQGDDTLFGNAGADTIFGDQMAVDLVSIASGTGGTATSYTFENTSPYAVELAQVDASGVITGVVTVASGASTTQASTTQTTWVVLDPVAGDILDVYDAPANGSTQTFASAGADTLFGGAGADTLSGDWGGDTLDGGLGADTLFGGTGDDTLIAGVGNDTLFGGDDADVITAQDGFGADVVEGGEGGDDNDTIDASALTNGATVTYTGDEAGTLASASGTADFIEIENLVLTDQDDTVDASADTAGATVTLGAGADSLLGGTGADTVFGGAGADTINGGAGADALTGGADADTFLIEDGFGADTITGGEAGTDVDTLNAGGVTAPVNVTFTGDEAGTATDGTSTATFTQIESVIGGAAADTLDASLSGVAQTLAGEAGADTLTGGAGNDLLAGGDDADIIFGGGGDTVDGGSGGDDNDTLYLGEFGTTIVYDSGDPESGTVTFADGSVLTFTDVENVVPCFTPGTLIRTAGGDRPVESLTPGCMVLTRDAGYQPLVWVGKRHCSAKRLALTEAMRPILIRADAIAPGLPARDMHVSPQHRMLVANPEVQLWLGQDEVLVKAKDMTHRPGIELSQVAEVTYVHIMCAEHQLVLANGAWSESFQPGDMVDSADEQEMFAEITALFPELAEAQGRGSYVAARLSAKRHEARLIC